MDKLLHAIITKAVDTIEIQDGEWVSVLDMNDILKDFPEIRALNEKEQGKEIRNRTLAFTYCTAEKDGKRDCIVEKSFYEHPTLKIIFNQKVGKITFPNLDIIDVDLNYHWL